MSPSLLDRLPDDFLDRRHPILDFSQPAHAEREHALVHGLAAQLETRRADEDQLAQLFAHGHDFVEADAALVPGEVALVTPAALERLDRVGVLLLEARLEQRRRRQRVRLLAVRADAAHEALR